MIKLSLPDLIEATGHLKECEQEQFYRIQSHTHALRMSLLNAQNHLANVSSQEDDAEPVRKDNVTYLASHQPGAFDKKPRGKRPLDNGPSILYDKYTIQDPNPTARGFVEFAHAHGCTSSTNSLYTSFYRRRSKKAA